MSSESVDPSTAHRRGCTEPCRAWVFAGGQDPARSMARTALGEARNLPDRAGGRGWPRATGTPVNAVGWGRSCCADGRHGRAGWIGLWSSSGAPGQGGCTGSRRGLTAPLPGFRPVPPGSLCGQLATGRAVHLKSLTLGASSPSPPPPHCAASPASPAWSAPTAPASPTWSTRISLGAGRAGCQVAARRQDGGRHLRRYDRPGAARPRRGLAHHRQLRRRAAHRLLRGLPHPPHVPRRRQRVRAQRSPLPAAWTCRNCSPTPASAARCTSSSGRASWTRCCARAEGPPRLHRGGGRRAQAPQAQGEGPAQAGRHAGQPARPPT